MKTTKTKTTRRNYAKKQQQSKKKSLEEMYRLVFMNPGVSAPSRERLSVYKSVPSITTYGFNEKPI